MAALASLTSFQSHLPTIICKMVLGNYSLQVFGPRIKNEIQGRQFDDFGAGRTFQ